MSFELGFHVPWTYDESALLAASLVDAAQRHGLGWSILSSGAHDSVVDERWDKYVRSGRAAKFSSWVKPGSTLTWFDVQPQKLAHAKQLKCRNVLVPLWHQLHPQDANELAEFDLIVCPTRSIYDSIQDRKLKNLSFCNWTGGFQRRAIAAELQTLGKAAWLIQLDNHAVVERSADVLCVVRFLLELPATRRVTLMTGKGWPRSTRKIWEDLWADYKPQLAVLHKPSYAVRQAAYRAHDWTWAVGLRSNSGILALEAAWAGQPLLAFDLPPFSDHLRLDKDALLLPCELQTNWLGAPTAQCRTSHVWDTLRELSAMIAERLAKFHASASWADSAKAVIEFDKFWRQAWQL